MKVLLIALLMLFTSSCFSTQETQNTDDMNAQSTQPSLYQTRWILNQIHSDQFKDSDDLSSMYLSINEAGQLNAFFGCNNIMSQVQVNESTLSFSSMIATRKMCYKNMDLEAFMMKSLKQINHFSLSANQLQLYQDQDLKFTFISKK